MELNKITTIDSSKEKAKYLTCSNTKFKTYRKNLLRTTIRPLSLSSEFLMHFFVLNLYPLASKLCWHSIM